MRSITKSRAIFALLAMLSLVLCVDVNTCPAFPSDKVQFVSTDADVKQRTLQAFHACDTAQNACLAQLLDEGNLDFGAVAEFEGSFSRNVLFACAAGSDPNETVGQLVAAGAEVTVTEGGYNVFTALNYNAGDVSTAINALLAPIDMLDRSGHLSHQLPNDGANFARYSAVHFAVATDEPSMPTVLTLVAENAANPCLDADGVLPFMLARDDMAIYLDAVCGNCTEGQYFDYEQNACAQPVAGQLVFSAGNGAGYAALVCPPGRTCNGGRLTESCEGKFYSHAGAGACSECGAGHYVTKDGALSTECTACAAGSYQPAQAQTGCEACPAGKYCPTGSAAGQTCPGGKTPSDTQTKCKLTTASTVGIAAGAVFVLIGAGAAAGIVIVRRKRSAAKAASAVVL